MRRLGTPWHNCEDNSQINIEESNISGKGRNVANIR